MNLPKFAMFLIITAIAISCRVSAASFEDDMSAPQNRAEVQYSGLKPFAGATYGLKDQAMLTFSDNSSPQGVALYRVNAAESITAGIYTFYGTCVSKKEAGLMLSQGTEQALVSKSKDAIYSGFGGSFWRIELDLASRYEPVFSLTNAVPEDAVGFGLNIYAVPGTDKPLRASVTKSVSEALCYEEYTAAIPAGTQYIMVEINDVTSYPLKDGGTMPNRIYTRLASVNISGEALVMGEPAKVEASSPVQTQSPVYGYGEEDKDEATEPYSAAVAADIVPEEALSENEPGEPSSSVKASSSKFEGTITSSSKREESQAPKSEAQIESPSSASKSRQAESEPAKDEIPRETVYEIRREDDGGGMSSGVTAYIIIVSGALALLLIFGKKK